MSTPLPVCPHELLSGCSTRLSFFTTLLISAINSDGSINWDNIQNQDGIYYSLHAIADDISTAQFIFEQREVTSKQLHRRENHEFNRTCNI